MSVSEHLLNAIDLINEQTLPKFDQYRDKLLNECPDDANQVITFLICYHMGIVDALKKHSTINDGVSIASDLNSMNHWQLYIVFSTYQASNVITKVLVHNLKITIMMTLLNGITFIYSRPKDYNNRWLDFVNYCQTNPDRDANMMILRRRFEEICPITGEYHNDYMEASKWALICGDIQDYSDSYHDYLTKEEKEFYRNNPRGA